MAIVKRLWSGRQSRVTIIAEGGMAEGQQNPISNHKSESTQHSHKTPYNAHTGRLEQIRRGNLLKRIAQPPINKNTDTSPAYIKHLKKSTR
jgi:hypothetical protein